jgi:hypothetical protein
MSLMFQNFTGRRDAVRFLKSGPTGSRPFRWLMRANKPTTARAESLRPPLQIRNVASSTSA